MSKTDAEILADLEERWSREARALESESSADRVRAVATIVALRDLEIVRLRRQVEGATTRPSPIEWRLPTAAEIERHALAHPWTYPCPDGTASGIWRVRVPNSLPWFVRLRVSPRGRPEIFGPTSWRKLHESDAAGRIWTPCDPNGDPV